MVDKKKSVVFLALGDNDFFRLVRPLFHLVIEGVEFFGGKRLEEICPDFNMTLADGPLFFLLNDIARLDDLHQGHGINFIHSLPQPFRVIKVLFFGTRDHQFKKLCFGGIGAALRGQLKNLLFPEGEWILLLCAAGGFSRGND